MASPRENQTATLLTNGKVLVAGGDQYTQYSALSSASLYDPASNTWSPAASMTQARTMQAAILLGNGKVLVAGGGYSLALASAELYDPVSDTWSSAGTMPTAAENPTATLLKNGKVLIAGGFVSNGVSLSRAELYDPSNNTWSSVGSMTTARFGHTATLLNSGKVLVTGGFDSNYQPLSSAELFDPVNNTWSPAAPMSTARAQQTATLLAKGMVLVSGGSGYLPNAELYDPVSNTWLSAGSMMTGRYGHTAILLNNGKVLVMGGTGFHITLASTELYDPGPSTTPGSQFSVSVQSGNAVVAGTPFLFTVQAVDSSGNPVSSYGGPASVMITSSPADGLGNLPITGTFNSLGNCTFLGTLKTAGSYTLTATAGSLSGSSGTISVAPANAIYFKVTAPSNATTGSPIKVSVTALDQFGNVATNYTGNVHFATTDGSAALPIDSKLANGVGVFNVTLNAAGSRTITATDTSSTIPVIAGTSSAILVRGLTVTSFVPMATGFTVTFSKPIVASDVNLFGGTVANPIHNITLVGKNTGSLLGPVNGILVIDPSGASATFKASTDWLQNIAGRTDGLLPNDTWSVTLQSGTGTGSTGNGFFDALGAPLDGANNGGHANYITTFTTANDGKPALTIPDFARGPDGAHFVRVPNDAATYGVPVTLYNASNVTDVTFMLSYNSALLTVMPDAGNHLNRLSLVGAPTIVDASHALAGFHYQNSTAESGTVVLGNIVAMVPDGAASVYKSKELLNPSSITVNGAPFAGVSAGGVHVNAYFGDLSGDGQITGLDLATAGNVAAGTPTSPIGLSAYKLVDPALIGDIEGDGSIDAGTISSLAAFLARVSTPAIPVPPSGLTIIPGGPDPALSLSASQPSGGIVNVSVLLDHPRPDGSTGMTEAILGLTYDPKVVTVSAADITLGTIPALGTGWRVESVIDPVAGQIAINLYSTTPITATDAGSLVNIAFHNVPGESPAAAGVQLVSAVTPEGRWFSTEVADGSGGFVLRPGLDQLTIQTTLHRRPWALRPAPRRN
jgi:hypothetical protein